MADECRIAVVDPYPLFRCGVLQTLQRCAGLTVVAEGATAKDAMRFVRKGQLDILVLEAAVPNSLDVIDAVLRVLPDLKLIVLASTEDHEHATSAIQAGATGYVIKGISGAGLVNVIESIRRGELYITPDFACRLLTKPEWLPAYGEPCLSSREQQVIDETLRGLTNQEIAVKLALGISTIKHYKSLAFKKLGARNRMEARVAMRNMTKLGSI